MKLSIYVNVDKFMKKETTTKNENEEALLEAGGAYKGSKDQLIFFVDMRKNK